MEHVLSLVIFGIILLFSGLILEIFEKDKGFWALSSILIVITMIGISMTKKPTAIDVYRGNTTLEITYKDNIPVDTVVVFK